MSRGCGQCPALRAQVARLERQVEFLRAELAAAIAGVRATVEFIEGQQYQPTMPRRQLVPAIEHRLTTIVDHAEGKTRR